MTTLVPRNQKSIYDAPIIINVQNGCLRLEPKTELIETIDVHNKCANVPYIPYSPDNIYVRQLEQVLLEIFNNNKETYEFWMMYLASELDDHPKTQQFFGIWHGDGSNGKSVISELDLNTFGLGRSNNGGGYAMKMDIEWFCTERKRSGPDSWLASTKNVRRLWCSESAADASPKCSKIRELMADYVVNNDKNEILDTWKVNSHVTVPTNTEMRISGRDYGTWRRILYYRFKRNFKRADGPISGRIRS